jgi:hypothetical protein
MLSSPRDSQLTPTDEVVPFSVGLLPKAYTTHTVLTLHAHAGGTNKQLDLQNPDNLGRQSTDNGVVPNLKWSFSDSKTRLLNGGWVREQVLQDLPQSHDVRYPRTQPCL